MAVSGRQAIEQEQDTLQWYSRRGGVIRGPFTSGDITRHLLLGRIRLKDELSTNKTTWTPVNSFSGMLPPEVINLHSWDDYQKLVEAQIQADERKSERRCAHCTNRVERQPERRRNQDRRRVDDNGLVRQYLYNHTDRQSTRRLLLLTLLLATISFAWLYPGQR